MPTTTNNREATLTSGVYTFSEAARIIRSVSGNYDVSPRRLRYWLNTGLASTVAVRDTDDRVLTFDDLVSLEIVRRFENNGASLQRVRRLDDRLREQFPDLEHPFAYKVLFTDGARVWAEVGDDTLIEVVGKRRNHYVWRDVISTFANEIRYDDSQPPHAVTWQLTPWVDVDPRIQFGMPVVRGTRIPVDTIRANLQDGSPEDVADWYDLELRAVLGVRDYLAFA